MSIFSNDDQGLVSTISTSGTTTLRETWDERLLFFRDNRVDVDVDVDATQTFAFWNRWTIKSSKKITRFESARKHEKLFVVSLDHCFPASTKLLKHSERFVFESTRNNKWQEITPYFSSSLVLWKIQTIRNRGVVKSIAFWHWIDSFLYLTYERIIFSMELNVFYSKNQTCILPKQKHKA